MEHVAECGTRSLCEMVLGIFENDLTFAEFLESLDRLRLLDPAVLSATGADLFVHQRLRLVPS
jgi:hypothetical protein